MHNRIKEYRLAMNITQKQLADQTKISLTTIAAIEKERYTPSIMSLYKIATALGISIEDILVREEEKVTR